MGRGIVKARVVYGGCKCNYTESGEYVLEEILVSNSPLLSFFSRPKT